MTRSLSLFGCMISTGTFFIQHVPRICFSCIFDRSVTAVPLNSYWAIVYDGVCPAKADWRGPHALRHSLPPPRRKAGRGGVRRRPRRSVTWWWATRPRNSPTSLSSSCTDSTERISRSEAWTGGRCRSVAGPTPSDKRQQTNGMFSSSVLRHCWLQSDRKLSLNLCLCLTGLFLPGLLQTRPNTKLSMSYLTRSHKVFFWASSLSNSFNLPPSHYHLFVQHGQTISTYSFYDHQTDWFQS